MRAWTWVKATARSIGEGIARFARKAWAELQDRLRSSLKRKKLLPLAVGLAFLAAWVSPLFAAGLVVALFDVPGEHRLLRMMLDIGVVALAMLMVTVVAEMAVVLAVLPIADLLNRFTDSVQHHVEELDAVEAKEAEPCLEAEPSFGLVPSA
jgi:hypothetical protein